MGERFTVIIECNKTLTMFGSVILTCYHMKEGYIPSSMAGAQDAEDALLPTPSGIYMNQTMELTMKVMHK